MLRCFIREPFTSIRQNFNESPATFTKNSNESYAPFLENSNESSAPFRENYITYHLMALCTENRTGICREVLPTYPN